MLVEHPFSQQATKLIQQGFVSSKTILYPTETLMAVGCVMDDKIAVAKLFKLKKRLLTKPMLMISDSWRNVLPWVEKLSDNTINVFESLNKHPLTIALPSQHFAKKFLNPLGKNLAFRITNNPCCLDLIKISQKPLVATSANISGKNSSQNLAKTHPKIKKNVDLIIKQADEDFNNNFLPSTLIEYKAPNKLVMVRQGLYSKDDIAKQLPKNWKVI